MNAYDDIEGVRDEKCTGIFYTGIKEVQEHAHRVGWRLRGGGGVLLQLNGYYQRSNGGFEIQRSSTFCILIKKKLSHTRAYLL